VLGFALAGVCAAALSVAADLSADQVREILSKASTDASADLAGKDLSDLDLSHLDLRKANLAGANLFGTRLVASNLEGAKLARANLNGAWLMGTKFAGADLSGSSMLSLVIAGGPINEKPNFAGADLSGVRMIADLPAADFHGANLSRARLGVDIKNQGMGQMRTDLSGANLAGANLQDADLNRSLMLFANLKGADLRSANLYRVNLSGADLTGADIANADFTEADIEGTGQGSESRQSDLLIFVPSRRIGLAGASLASAVLHGDSDLHVAAVCNDVRVLDVVRLALQTERFTATITREAAIDGLKVMRELVDDD
jgi:uncharacterized protein YjbI with pentapeptide repeats